MRQTEIILFVVVMLINGGIALYKKYKQREAERAAKSLETLARGARAERQAPRPARPTAAVRAKSISVGPTAVRAKSAVAGPTSVPGPDRPAMRHPRPAADQPSSVAKVVEELERKIRERLAAGAAPTERVIPMAAVPPIPASVPAIARVAARTGAAAGAVNVAFGRPALGTRRALRNAIIASEVLGRPRADRPFGA